MAGLLPPVVATLIADTKEYTAKMTEAQAKMTEFGAASESSAGMFGLSASTIAIGAVGVATAVGVYAVESAYKFQEGLDKIKNQAGLTTLQMEELGKSIRNISVVTGVSTSDLETAALTVEQAGIHGAAATKLLTDAAKAAVITNASVADTTKAIVAAQTLQISKGMEVDKLTGILIAGSKGFVGGLAAEEQMLQGRVGVALSKYGLSLQTIIPLGAEFSKVALPTRSIATFANALGNLQKPMTDSKGKLTAYAQGLNLVGLSQEKLARDLRVGNITGILTQIKQAAQESGKPLSEVTQAVFGSTGSGTASVLIKNLNDLAAAQKNLAGAGAGTLKTGWSNVTTQLGPQIKILQTQVQDLVLSLGQILLPKVLVGVQWANKFITDTKKFFDTHPIVMKAVAEVFKVSFGPLGDVLKALGWVANHIIPSSTPKSTSPFAGPNSRLVINNTATVRSNSGKW